MKIGHLTVACAAAALFATTGSALAVPSVIYSSADLVVTMDDPTSEGRWFGTCTDGQCLIFDRFFNVDGLYLLTSGSATVQLPTLTLAASSDRPLLSDVYVGFNYDTRDWYSYVAGSTTADFSRLGLQHDGGTVALSPTVTSSGVQTRELTDFTGLSYTQYDEGLQVETSVTLPSTTTGLVLGGAVVLSTTSAYVLPTERLTLRFTLQPVPEPASTVLLLAGLVGLGVITSRRR